MNPFNLPLTLFSLSLILYVGEVISERPCYPRAAVFVLAIVESCLYAASVMDRVLPSVLT